MNKDNRHAWFAAKRYGYGSGLPIAWQGWLTLGLFLAVTFAAPVVLSPVAVVPIVVVAVAVLLVICAKRTAGGWRWRNGGRQA
jgi:hypothetical protein